MDLSFQTNYWFGFPESNSDIILNLTHWQYWWWFWFTYFLSLYYFFFLKLIRNRLMKFHPKIVTSYRAHGKWGDFIICLLPISWCINILSNSNFILRMLEWQTESNLFTIRIRGKQWYWIYKIEVKTLIDINKVPKNIGHNNWIVFNNTSLKINQFFLNMYQLKSNKTWLETYLDTTFNKNNISKAFTINRSSKFFKLNKPIKQNITGLNEYINFSDLKYYFTKLTIVNNVKFFEIYQTNSYQIGHKYFLKNTHNTIFLSKNKINFKKIIQFSNNWGNIIKNYIQQYNINNNISSNDWIIKGKTMFGIKIIPDIKITFSLKKSIFFKELLKRINSWDSTFSKTKKTSFNKNFFIFDNNYFNNYLRGYFKNLLNMEKFLNPKSYFKFYWDEQIKKIKNNVTKIFNRYKSLKFKKFLINIKKINKTDKKLKTIMNTNLLKKNLKKFKKINYNNYTYYTNNKLLDTNIGFKKNFISHMYMTDINRYLRNNFFSKKSFIKVNFLNKKFFLKFSYFNNKSINKSFADNLYLIIKQKRYTPTQLLTNYTYSEKLQKKPYKFDNMPRALILNNYSFFNFNQNLRYLKKLNSNVKFNLNNNNMTVINNWLNYVKNYNKKNFNFLTKKFNIYENFELFKEKNILLNFIKLVFLKNNFYRNNVYCGYKYNNKIVEQINQTINTKKIINFHEQPLKKKFFYKIFSKKNSNIFSNISPFKKYFFKTNTRINLYKNFFKNNNFIALKNLEVNNSYFFLKNFTQNFILKDYLDLFSRLHNSFIRYCIKNTPIIYKLQNNLNQNLKIYKNIKNISNKFISNDFIKNKFSINHLNKKNNFISYGNIGLTDLITKNININFIKNNFYKIDKLFDKNINRKIYKAYKFKNNQFITLNNKRLLRTRRILVLPSNINITLITNSFDVVHSWYIPGLGIKMDCIPGRSTHHTLHIDHAGFYYGQCAEICGRFHHHMPIRVCALPFEHFLIWWYHYGYPYFHNKSNHRKQAIKTIIKQYNW